MRMAIAKIFGAVIILIIIIAVFLRPAPLIDAVNPEQRDISVLIIGSGTLRAVRQSDIGSDVTARISKVFVDEGDKVVPGQVIVALDQNDVLKQVRQAKLAKATSQAELQSVLAGPMGAEVRRAMAQLEQSRKESPARVEAARQKLRELERGGRAEDIARAQAALDDASSARRQAERDYNRFTDLYEKGAVARVDADNARTRYERAKAAEDAADQQLELAKRPATREQIESARAELKAAEAAANGSVKVASESVNILKGQPRPENVLLAKTRLDEASAAVDTAQVMQRKRLIRSPISGIVVRRSAEPGQSVSPGSVLISVADMGRTEVVFETDEINLHKVALGQVATIIAPAFKDKPFKAVVSKVGPEIDSQRGVVAIRLKPVSLPKFARPDMTVDVNIEVRRLSEGLSVPISSVIQVGEKNYVYIVSSGRAVRKEVVVAGKNYDYAAIDGVKKSDLIVLRATEVEDGQRVRTSGG